MLNARAIKHRSGTPGEAPGCDWLSDRGFSHIVRALAAVLTAIASAQLMRILAGSDESVAALIVVLPVAGLMLVSGWLATQTRREAALDCMTAALLLMQFNAVFVQGFGIHAPGLWAGGLVGTALAFSVLPARRAFPHAATFLLFALFVLLINDLDIVPPGRWNRIPPDSHVLAGLAAVAVLGGGLVCGTLAHLAAPAASMPDASPASVPPFMLHPPSETSQCVSVKGLFEQLQREFSEQLAEKNLHFGFNLTPRSPDLIIANRDRLLAILRPLLDNAIRYTNDGGLMLGITNRINSDPACWRIDVADSGIGMRGDTVAVLNDLLSLPARDLARQAKTGATGGLHAVARAVNELGGHAGVSSMAGLGSTFWVYLRLEPASESGADDTPSAANADAPH